MRWPLISTVCRKPQQIIYMCNQITTLLLATSGGAEVSIGSTNKDFDLIFNLRI